MKERVVEKTMATRGSLMVLLSLVIIPLLSLTVSSQQSPIPAVLLDCDNFTPEMIVHPEQLAPVTINCTLENNSLYKEEIKLESEVSENGFVISLSPSGPHEVESGETVSVEVIFVGSARMDAQKIDFNLMATVMTITIVSDPIKVPWDTFGATSNKSGTIESLVYHKPVLDMNEKGPRNLESNEESILTFSILNDGNSDDRLEVAIDQNSVTALENAGFQFSGDSFVRFNMVKGGMENSNITIIAPKSIVESTTVEILLQARSMDADNDEHVQSISLTITAEKSSGGVGGITIDGLSSLSDDEMKIYSAFGGGILILLLLVIVISKITKKGNKHDKKNYVEESPIDVVEDVAANPVDEFDFEDLDLDDIDDDLSDLDDIDEFDFEDI